MLDSKVSLDVTLTRSFLSLIDLLLSFQASISGLVLLYAIAQKQIHGYEYSAYQNELDRARQCLEVLAFCAQLDPVARRYRETLASLYNQVWRDSMGRPPRAAVLTLDPLLSSPVSPSSSPTFTIPENAPAHQRSATLRMAYLLCDVFMYPGSSGDAWQIQSMRDPTRREFAHMSQTLAWQLMTARPFQWTNSEIVHPQDHDPFDSTTAPNQYMDNQTPREWPGDWMAHGEAAPF